jgi:tetratricopeptide (TPR) repeat protein
MKKIFLILVLFGSISRSNACLNYFYSTDKEGHLHLVTDELRKKFNINFNKELNVSRLLKLEAKLKKDHVYMLLSDYALGLMKLGKTEESLQILSEIYKHYPNDYKIASNLGTAYELRGMNDSALKYIKRGLQLNPNDHEGSEWVHVKVLETKLKLAKNPDHLKTSTVLGLTETQEKDSNVCRQILIQAHERFPFTPKNDLIMASLMTDLGDCYANTIAVEYALSSYMIAKEYFGDKSASLETKIKEMKELMKKYINVRPNPKEEELKGRYEGMHNKVGPFSYKLMLENNDSENYKVDWSRINTNVTSLLALANFTISETDVKESAVKNSTDDVKFVPDPAPIVTVPVIANNSVDTPTAEISQGTKPIEEKGKTNWLLLSSGGTLAVILIAIAVRRRKRKSGNG